MKSSNTMPDWITWVAQDADGTLWGYEVEPLQHDNGWYENEVGRYIRLSKTEANPQWHTTCERVKAQD